MAVDMELRKAFSDLQMKMVDTQTQMRISDGQINAMMVEKKKTELAISEVSSVPEDAKMYESVGRMFVLEPRATVMENLEAQHKLTDTKIKDLEAKKLYLEKSVKSSEENLREMVLQRRK
ncbi:prefoldin subunit 1-like [Ciona intestinalis]